MRRFIEGVVPFLVIAAILAVVVLGMAGLGRWRCDRWGDITNRHTEYHLPGGCFVEVNGQLIPDGVWREFEE